MLRKDWMKDWSRRAVWLTMPATLCWMVPSLSYAAGSNVPPAVVSSVSTVSATGLAGDESNVALDACGNIYAIQQYGGEVDEIPAGGGTASVVLAAGGANYDPAPLAMDAAKKNLFVLQGASGSVYQIPIVNCKAVTASQTNFNIGSLGAISYYWSGSSVATDSAGDVFIGTNVACCAPVNELLVMYASNSYASGATLLGASTSLASPITSIAVDSSNNVYYVSGGALFELPVATPATSSASAVYSATPISFGSGYTTVVGVTLDAAGNMYVADSGSSTIFEIPYETNGSVSALNPSDQFIVATGVTIANAVAPDPSGNLYFTNNGSSVNELTVGNANLGSRAVAGSATATLTVAFNAAVTPASIGFVSGNGVFSAAAGGTCTAKTAYTAGESCTVNTSFAPAAPGLAKGALVLTGSTGEAFATANLYGWGLGAGLTVDPGSVTSIGTGLKTPASVALDVTGDLFIADSESNTVWEITAGNTTPVSIGTGLSAPEGVATDGAGNVYIADTGNSRIVMVPVVSGALSNSAQTVLVSGTTSIAGSTLKSPAGLSADAQGNLYIADTGNNRIVFLPQNNDWDVNLAFTLGSGFNSPLATTATTSGLVYIADSGDGKVYSIPYPGATAPLTLVATGFNDPSALRTDAAGDLFVVDKGNTQVLRIPNVAGSLVTASAVNVSLGIADPYGLALDSAGNLYVSDGVNAAAYMVARTNVTQSFGIWNPATTSTPASFQVENAGDQALTFNSPYYAATGNTSAFTLSTSEADACANGATIAVGADCLIEATFTPPTGGSYSETLAFSSNAVNATAPQIVFTGTGAITAATTTTLTVTSPSGVPYYGQAIALSVSVTSGSGTPVGSVALLVDGVQTATGTLNSSGVTTFTIANGLTGGAHALQASYQGATTPTTIYSRSVSTVDTVNVSQVATATALSVATLYSSPSSQPAGTALTLTAVVSSTYAGIPTGTVTFTIQNSGAATVTQTAPVAPASGGAIQATYSYTPPAPAAGVVYNTVTVSASYSGDENFSGSSTGTQSFDVTPAGGSIVVTPSGTGLTSSSTNASSVTFTPVSYGGWNGLVGFSCLVSSLPANARCVWSPGQAQVMPSTSTATAYTPPVNLTITIDQPPQTPTASGLVWWLSVVTGLLLFFARRRWSHAAWGTATLLLGMVMLGVAASGLLACTSGNQFATPPGTSTVTVYASADPFTTLPTSGTPTPPTQACPANSPATAPCSQQAFQVTLMVQ